MAWTDILFAEGDGQNFVVELPVKSYTGTSSDALSESGSDGGPMILEVVLKRLKARIIKAVRETSRSASS